MLSKYVDEMENVDIINSLIDFVYFSDWQQSVRLLHSAQEYERLKV